MIDSVNEFRNIARASASAADRVLLGSDILSWGLVGCLDQLYFYGRAINESEISQLYNSGSGI